MRGVPNLYPRALGVKTGLRPPDLQPDDKKSWRKDSMAIMSGLAEHMTNILHEHGGSSIASRLEAVEESTKKGLKQCFVRWVETLGTMLMIAIRE